MENQKPNEPPLILRQSVVCLGFRLIVLQMLLTATYFFILFPMNLFTFPAEMKLVVYPIINASLIALVIVQMALTLKVILDWLSHYYVIAPGEILFKTGFLMRKEKIYLLKHIESITCNQGFFERLLDYGTIRLYNPILRQSIHIDCIKHPEKYIQFIEKNLPEMERKEVVIAPDKNL